MTIKPTKHIWATAKQNPLQMFQQPKDMSVEPTMTSISEDFLMDLKKTNDSLKNQIKTSSAPTTGSGATAFNWFSLPQAEAKQTKQYNKIYQVVKFRILRPLQSILTKNHITQRKSSQNPFRRELVRSEFHNRQKKYGMSLEEFKNLPAAPYQVDDNIDSPMMPNPISASKAIMWNYGSDRYGRKTMQKSFCWFDNNSKKK